MVFFWVVVAGVLVVGYPTAMSGAANAAHRLTGREASAETQRAKDLGALTFFIVSMTVFLTGVFLWPDKGLWPTVVSLLVAGVIGEFVACVFFGPAWTAKSRRPSADRRADKPSE